MSSTSTTQCSMGTTPDVKLCSTNPAYFSDMQTGYLHDTQNSPVIPADFSQAQLSANYTCTLHRQYKNTPVMKCTPHSQ